MQCVIIQLRLRLIFPPAAPVNRSESDTTASPHVPQAQLNLALSVERLSIPNQANTSPRSTPSPPQRTSPRPESQSTSRGEGEAPEFSPTSRRSSRPFVTANQFVEPELLYGACKYPSSIIKYLQCLPCSTIAIGNHPPPMENYHCRGCLPNVLAVPYGKGRPVHIRAISWRKLLKLMAKLSTTQIEPTIEARAETKGALLLRTVIQFFKV